MNGSNVKHGNHQIESKTGKFDIISKGLISFVMEDLSLQKKYYYHLFQYRTGRINQVHFGKIAR